MMKGISIKNSLFWKLTATLTLLLLVLGLAYAIITSIAANRYFEETTQRLHANVAKEMLLEVQPFADGEVNKPALDQLMHSMMAVNPHLEVYLISPTGEILSYVVLKEKVKLTRIDLAPVQQFIQNNGANYILGDDPKNPGEKAIFSATEVVSEGVVQGYVYMVLASEKYEDIASTLLGSYWLTVGTRSFLITLVGAFLLGLGLIYLLTRNLRDIIDTVRRFEEGDLTARIPEKQGELGTLSRTFNQMADTILRNIEDLKEVDSLRRELISNVSHDLRSPLAVMHGYIETLMIKDDISEEDRQKYYKIILDSSTKLKHLVNSLFELSKLETGQIKPNMESFMINELLQDASHRYSLLAKSKNVNFSSEVDRKLPLVYGDISMIDRVVENLVDNALKYTPENGWVKVDARQSNDEVQVEIQNSGEGIPQDELRNIFDRYYMVDKNKSGIDGSGLGLAIVKKILDLHNVKIKVESIPNQFTRFEFRLPVPQS